MEDSESIIMVKIGCREVCEKDVLAEEEAEAETRRKQYPARLHRQGNETAIDFIFPTHEAVLYGIHISLLVFRNYSRPYKMAP